MKGNTTRLLVCFTGVLAAILLAGASAGAAPQKELPRIVVLRCGRLLDVKRGTLERNQVIVVTGNTITAVGPAATVRIPESAETMDLSRATCLPGLADMHTHLIDDAEGYAVAGPLTRSGAQLAFSSIPHAQATLDAGFTSVRDVGTYRAFVDVALRDAINRGIVPGPRIQPAGAYVTITGGAGALTGLAPDVELPRELRFGVADGTDQVRQRVRDIIRNGAGMIKVLATGAVLTPGSTPGAQEFTEEELRAAVEEAKKAGLKVACHAHGAAGAKAAIRAGVASIEHGSYLDEEALQMMKERGVFFVADPYNSVAIYQNKSYLDEFMEKNRQTTEAQIRAFRRALELGVRIAYGTDAAVIPHGDNGRQFATYVELGMTPLQAIRTATTEAAELLGWSDRTGSIEPGKLADIIAVRENPLENIRTLEQVVFVMKDGKVFKNEK
ncbi:MAG: amidohydrolase family protein [Acidobacteria bacterium]|nr:amidohydrolase family protein [Acidobacteriota bacterium]MBI3664287.1 amidohydrolase family protein [Acidobacteriota bacterium]